MTSHQRAEAREQKIRDFYREVLKNPALTDTEVERLRAPVRLLAQAICDHVWEKKGIQ